VKQCETPVLGRGQQEHKCAVRVESPNATAIGVGAVDLRVFWFIHDSTRTHLWWSCSIGRHKLHHVLAGGVLELLLLMGMQ
jgi:hypothetical protein